MKYAVKVLMKSNNAWHWVIPMGKDPNFPYTVIPSEAMAQLLAHIPAFIGDRKYSEADIEDATFDHLDKAKRAVICSMLLMKRDISAIKIASIYPIFPTFKEREVISYQDIK